MSEITEALNRISQYLERNNPNALNWLQSGLSDREIDLLTKDFPFEFPLELRELYRWRNGREINKRNWEQGYKYAFIFPANGYRYLDNFNS